MSNLYSKCLCGNTNFIKEKEINSTMTLYRCKMCGKGLIVIKSGKNG